ncbi:hypothetical protein ASG52_19770 [Methylobacterium sp. Leaf456]|nr:hypothetical protein ASG52_19770 [Methylobacterium sp. Leaf456]
MFDVENHDVQHDESSMVIARVSAPDDFLCRDQEKDGAFAAECEANGRVLAAAPEMLVQLKGLLGFARFIVSGLNIDADQTKVVLKNRGESVAEVPLALLLERSEAAVAKAEGR